MASRVVGCAMCGERATAEAATVAEAETQALATWARMGGLVLPRRAQPYRAPDRALCRYCRADVRDEDARCGGLHGGAL